MGRAPIADLVVMDHRAPIPPQALLGQALEGIDIVVGATGAAMEDDQRRLGSLEIACDAVPSLIVPEAGIAFPGFGVRRAHGCSRCLPCLQAPSRAVNYDILTAKLLTVLADVKCRRCNAQNRDTVTTRRREHSPGRRTPATYQK